MSVKIYKFGQGVSDGDSSMKTVIGGKGANLCQMSKDGINVPPGFVIPTSECLNYYSNGNILNNNLKSIIKDGVKFIENSTSKVFDFSNKNDDSIPLLVSVRSGAPVSMPGMMDTILNLGLNDRTVQILSKKTNNKRFAMDSYRRFIQMYSSVVLDIDHHNFEEVIDNKKLSLGIKNDSDFSAEDFEFLVSEYKNIVKLSTGSEFPQDVWTQIYGAVEAVFKSWNNDRAKYYRKLNSISDSLGTAVTIQSMVFGNLGDTSATGVAFTRNPSNGQKYLYGEFLVNAQGEDVVAGIRTPNPINTESSDGDLSAKTMLDIMPEVYKEFVKITNLLETSYRDMQDIEFTIEQGKLYILQTRSGKRTARAAVKIAVDMINEGLISKREAVMRISPNSLNSLLHNSIDPQSPKQVLDKGLPASPGAASGVVAFSPEHVKELYSQGVKSILVRLETSPEDIEGMNLSAGILTARGGMTSHAAVVARGMGKTCVTGARSIDVDYKKLQFITKDGIIVKQGDRITIDGTNGYIYLGEVKTIAPEFFDEFKTILSICDEINKTKVRTNAETPADCKTAVSFGAQGIGLCRTEHMFFEKTRILYVRQMILAQDNAQREIALNKLLPYQKNDFIEIFEIMNGLPVNIRLLDPPLHEFLPQKQEDINDLAKELAISPAIVKARVDALHEQNPMLGHRGCRLAVTYPQIYAMQARAIFEAACDVMKKTSSSSKIEPQIEIMIPFIVDNKELLSLKNLINDVYNQVCIANQGFKVSYTVGTMIETPRAAILADKIAQTADYFSFGTNDLTQTTMALSRDDSASFIKDYIEKNIFEYDPFEILDQEGVGELIKIAAQKGRSIKPSIKLGICGEHGGEPESVKFFCGLGFDYVSCSPYRVPIAKVAAAQAWIEISSKKQ
jgi:pyruvate,orthophosphate dikinase